MAAHRGGNRVRQFRRQIVESSANRAPEPARSKLANRFIDRNDPADFQGLACLLFCTVRAGAARIPQNLELRLNDLQLSAALIFLDLAIERDHLAGDELVAQVRGIEPQAAQTRAPLSHGELKDWHAPRVEQPGVANFADYRRHLAGTQFGNPARIQPVFIAKRKIMQQVADRVNSLGGKNFADARTNALHILNRSGKFEHTWTYEL